MEVTKASLNHNPGHKSDSPRARLIDAREMSRRDDAQVIPMCYTCDTSVIPVSCPNDTCVILLQVSYVKDRITALRSSKLWLELSVA